MQFVVTLVLLTEVNLINNFSDIVPLSFFLLRNTTWEFKAVPSIEQ